MCTAICTAICLWKRKNIKINSTSESWRFFTLLEGQWGNNLDVHCNSFVFWIKKILSSLYNILFFFIDREIIVNFLEAVCRHLDCYDLMKTITGETLHWEF
jgi:hypothetical protein